MKRRAFLGQGLAAAGAIGAAGPLFANDSQIPDYGLGPDLQPQLLTNTGYFQPFELHVDPSSFSLYWTLPNQEAMRYTCGIGRPGLYEDGEFYVGAKKEWPSWTPTPDMIERDPEQYKKHEDGMPGGINNPLGSRALYLFQPGRGDTFLRIHGTNDASTIGKRVSNGCARLVNDQMIDLYDRVFMDSRVVLYPVG